MFFFVFRRGSTISSAGVIFPDLDNTVNIFVVLCQKAEMVMAYKLRSQQLDNENQRDRLDAELAQSDMNLVKWSSLTVLAGISPFTAIATVAADAVMQYNREPSSTVLPRITYGD